MVTFTKQASELWRDYNTEGVPASGGFSPIKGDIRTWGGEVEDLLDGTVASDNVNATDGEISLGATGVNFRDPADTTKKLRINLSAFTTATVRTWALPDLDDSFVGAAATQTLTNKTLTSPVISGGTINNAVIGGTTPAAGTFAALIATSLNNTPIGGTTPAAGAFTTLSASGQATLSTIKVTADNTEFSLGAGDDFQAAFTGSIGWINVDTTYTMELRIADVAQLSVEADAVVFKKGVKETVYALSGTTPALNPANGTIQTWTLTGNSTPTDSLASGEFMELHILDGSTYTITWPTIEWVGGSAPSLHTTATSIVVLQKVGSTLRGQLRGYAS